MIFDVVRFGAVGNGTDLAHEAIQQAIDACADAGGGTVYFPAGTYLCGTLRLKSGVHLHLEQGAVIAGSEDAALYPEICKTPYGNLPGQIQALLWADGVSNVAITGQGIIDGGGNSPLSPNEAVHVRFRPALIFYRDCHNVKFLDITLQYSCFWTLHLLRCSDVLVRGVTILAHRERINTDGIDPDGCRNVIISDCMIKTGDDCIVIKSTEGDACENMTITNCILSSRHAALKLGTEAIGPIRNIAFNNCIINQTNVAMALYMKDGSSYENIMFSNMVVEAYNEFPVVIDVTPRYYKEPAIGHIRGIVFDNMMFTGKGRMYIEGAEEAPISDLTLRNITWNITGPCKTSDVKKPDGARRIEIDPNRINYAVHPYQLIAIHVDGLLVSNWKVFNRSGNELLDRGRFYLQLVDHVTLEHIRHPETMPGLEQAVLIDCDRQE
ncbi:Exo-poly-alpha-D-galacturonosidase [Paenibacillus solanacearum]|uniref:Exo-poly-alpha-D-galacturonosidase n=2 Tax=Paenibacillus solanacearum TaxID=2048548 RepID=A0A916K0W6_9BACL|nr:Exo-poly-alpha-D-galacturonosidase [Paenibacillus solanacearum]